MYWDVSKLSEVLECCEGSERHKVSVFRKVLELLEVHLVNVRCCGVSECLDLSECLDVSGCRKVIERLWVHFMRSQMRWGLRLS